MLIGDSVIHDGHTYVIVGFTPASVAPAEIQLTEPETGMTFWLETEPLSRTRFDGTGRASCRSIRRIIEALTPGRGQPCVFLKARIAARAFASLIMPLHTLRFSFVSNGSDLLDSKRGSGQRFFGFLGAPPSSRGMK